jgi:hypothetical protein
MDFFCGGSGVSGSLSNVGIMDGNGDGISGSVGKHLAGKDGSGGGTVAFSAEFAGIQGFLAEFPSELSGNGNDGLCGAALSAVFSVFFLSSSDKSHAANATIPPIMSNGGAAAIAGARVAIIGAVCLVFIIY